MMVPSSGEDGVLLLGFGHWAQTVDKEDPTYKVPNVYDTGSFLSSSVLLIQSKADR